MPEKKTPQIHSSLVKDKTHISLGCFESLNKFEMLWREGNRQASYSWCSASYFLGFLLPDESDSDSDDRL